MSTSGNIKWNDSLSAQIGALRLVRARGGGCPARFQRDDTLIGLVAVEHHLDPMLLKAVVWRESRFDPQKYGTAGERGLMQVSQSAANEWARENKIDNFQG